MNGRQEDIASAVPADLDCISAAPAALDHYLVALPAMSLIPVAPLYLGCSRSARPLPRGFTGHVAHPSRSIHCHGRAKVRAKN